MVSPNARPHGGVRGDTLSRGSLLAEGPFGKIFRALPPAELGDTDPASDAALTALAAAMTAVTEEPNFGVDAEESGIPSAYTYFGQFIDHDLTFDPASSLQRQNDPDALVNFRTPRFDLDNVYGRGFDDQPYLYDKDMHFLRGRRLTGARSNLNATDLVRSVVAGANGAPDKEQARAIIGDPRNDENVIVSQLQGLFHRFHNAVVDDNQGMGFEAIQRLVRWHYQWVVLNDFLPTIIDADTLDKVLPHLRKGTNVVADPPRLRFFNHPASFMPLEFSAAAYRFGHSMVRPGYKINDIVPPLQVFGRNLPLDATLTGFREFPANWALDWGRFIDIEPRSPDGPDRTQLAYRIDTSLAGPLGNLPDSIARPPFNILARRNLLRGWRLRLPSGQAVARAMGLEPLTDDKILIGKFTGQPGDEPVAIDTIGIPAGATESPFKDNCPLWTYILAETVESDVTVNTTAPDGTTVRTRKLGPVGGTIVAETFVRLLTKDSSSYLSQFPLWKPSMAVDGKFGLRELIKIALAH